MTEDWTLLALKEHFDTRFTAMETAVKTAKGGMNTNDFKAYMHILRAADDPHIQIHWPVIDIEGIEAHDQAARFGLQLADIAVSGLTWGLEPDFYGNCEPRYAKALKRIIYHRGTNYRSYGTKIVPAADTIPQSAELDEFLSMFG